MQKRILMECDFPEDYSRFLEYLLGKVDHKDKESVVLAYGLYQETRKENYGMADILRLAQQKIEVNHAGREAETETVREFERYQEYPEREYMETAQDGYGAKQRRSAIQDRKAGNAETDWKPGMVRARQIQTDTVKESSGLFGRWKQRRKERREEKQREQEREMQMPWDTMFVSETSPDYGTLSSVHLPQQSSGTVLLNPESRESGSVARRLTALDAGETDIVISYYPFIIGKQENLADYILDRETVSRLHLRIDQKDGRYYVQDLNSTNGTMVDGRMLENNETAEIWEGVEVNIAGVRYRFE